MKKPHSLRFMFNRFVFVSLLLILGIALFSNGQSYNFWRQYRRTFTLFDELSRFYAEIEWMNLRMKSFLYSRDPLEFRASENHFALAEEALARLQEYQDEELRFRFSLLGNMLLTYQETSEAIFQPGGQVAAQVSYDRLDRLAYLIEETYPQYARLVTSEMNREKEHMLRQWQNQLVLTLLVFILFMLLAGFFSFISVRSITRPVEELLFNINRIKQGEFDVPNVQSESREIGILLESFEEMAADLKAHINGIHEKSRMEKELIEKEKVLAETRLNALQSKMNPHFLFNTLSLISKMAYVEGAEQTSDLMVRTASMLRYSLDMGGRTSTLGEELVCVENYIKIQEKRAGDRILFQIEHSGRFKETPIPGMILQPLVENSVVHGVKDMVKDAEVVVRLDTDGSSIRIEVADNGCGYPPEVLAGFHGGTLESSGIGLSNVRERLALFFKEECSMELENREGAVTRLLLPLGRSS